MGEYYDLAKMVGAFITFIGGIYAAYYRLKYLVKQQAEKSKELEKQIEDEKINRAKEIKEEELEREQAIKNLLSTFQDGLKNEVAHLQSIMLQQKDSLERLWSRVDDISDLISRVDTKLESHIKNQETICKINHRWNGLERRNDGK